MIGTEAQGTVTTCLVTERLSANQRGGDAHIENSGAWPPLEAERNRVAQEFDRAARPLNFKRRNGGFI